MNLCESCLWAVGRRGGEDMVVVSQGLSSAASEPVGFASSLWPFLGGGFCSCVPLVDRPGIHEMYRYCEMQLKHLNIA